MKERISELMDGELDGQAALRVIEALESDREALEIWRSYHLISDAMRDTPLLSPGFAAHLAEKLAQEPTVLAPKRVELGQPARPRVAMPAAIAASFAALALVGWLAFAPQGQGPAPAQVAVQTPSVQAVIQPVVSLQPQTVPLPSATSDYLLAHQGFSPRVSLQGMAAYARTVSDQATEGRK
jgi:sigma-E factor negative regulatory protein RseA